MLLGVKGPMCKIGLDTYTYRNIQLAANLHHQFLRKPVFKEVRFVSRVLSDGLPYFLGFLKMLYSGPVNHLANFSFFFFFNHTIFRLSSRFFIHSELTKDTCSN